MVRDKTFVVWASPANLIQRGGSALTLDDGRSHFDGIVFGELSPAKWMPGSDYYARTSREQEAWPAETVTPASAPPNAPSRTVGKARGFEDFVEMAISYRGREVSVYRNGRLYAHYDMASEPQEFGEPATVLFGRRHLDAGDPQGSFEGRIRDARIYDVALSQEQIAALRPDEAGSGPKPWAWWSFGDEGLREKTGRFTEIRLIGDVRIDGGCLVLGGKGASVIETAPGEEGRTAPTPATWSENGPVSEAVVRSARLLREKLLADPYRPGYHFCVPEDIGIPGDPNGAFYHDGVYHLMYLYNRSGSGFSWGHVSSTDLVHWRQHPDAIGPGDGDDGCFSGGGFVDDDGTAYLSYWMLWGARGIGLASSHDPEFDVWTKSKANPVIRSTEFGVTETTGPDGEPLMYGTADPSNIWKKDGRYYMLTGNLPVLNKIGRSPNDPLTTQGDRTYLFESKDLAHWTYQHVFYERKPEWTDRSEDDMCPSFLPLPSKPEGGAPSGKYLLLFISHNRGCQYYVGDYRDDRFNPTSHGRMTWIDNTFFAPEALVDGKGRQIMWAWLTDNPDDGKVEGWSGVYGLPRVLWLGPDGTLKMRPVDELKSLRYGERSWSGASLSGARKLEGVRGDSCELEIDVTPGSAARCGAMVRSSPDGHERTLVYYDAKAEELVFDATKSGGAGRMVVERAPLALAPRETLRLRVFVDKSVVEVFANDRQAISRRVYPVGKDSFGLSLFSEGGATGVYRVSGWSMFPSNPY
ncbi:MAG TPA: GH32 C-terminal domain-containing protein [Fimbriimonadaceae bacterium]|nr:GH32 C-terminal domain-containing protein [Fimbriimonadaceae bacterium]